MSDGHVIDELSAYIDGEASDPQRVARHIQSCPVCARRHMELLKVSNQLKSLRAPDMDALFLTRVLSRVESNPEPRRSLWACISPGRAAVALAASLAVILGVLYLVDESAQEPGSVAGPIAGSTVDETAVLALHDLLDDELWVDPYFPDDEEDSPEESPTVDELLDALAAWSSDSEMGAWYEDDDLLSVLEALAEEDPDLLGDLARDHWGEV